jgi:hypothetical protein
MKRLLMLVLINLVATQIANAQEARVVLRSTVMGNQEQPKVLYIVPWQQAETPELIYQPLQSLVEGVFEQVDREEFLRELRYRKKISASLEVAKEKQ